MNVSTTIMRPNSVPIPHTAQFVRHLTEKEASTRVAQALPIVYPKQWWPDKDLLEEMRADVIEVFGGKGRGEWYERMMVVRSESESC